MTPPITDTDLVNALENGIMAFTTDFLDHGVWTRQWTCRYDGDRVTVGSTFREAVQLALLDRRTRGTSTTH